MNNSVVFSVVSHKCLGVDFDERLPFDIYVEELYQKICSGTDDSRKVKQFIPLCSLIIDAYRSPLWDKCDKTLIKRQIANGSKSCC